MSRATEPSPKPQRASQTESHAIAGFPKLALARIAGAQKLNKLTIYMVMLALAIFVLFGTLASLKLFNDNETIYLLFHYLPYAVVCLAIPLLLYQAFIVGRYRLAQPSMLLTSVGLASLLSLVCVGFGLQNWLWIAMAAWIGVAYWLQATFKRLFKFIAAQQP